MNDLDGQPPPLNPFAPTSHLGSVDFDEAASKSAEFSNLRIILSVIASVTASGGLFGVVLSAVAFGSILLFGGMSEFGTDVLPLVWAVAFATAAGLVIAGVASAILVPLVFLLSSSLKPSGSPHWDRRSINKFGAICGFLSGWIPAIFLTGSGISGVLVGLIPAGFAVVVAPLLLRRLLR
ncbi:hypothetical protein Enr13x_14740 [Stieleria neptunia]|uniref:Uncharacterized protein n=1 Tax=Stieleria neptunia TaxID=2527979 RepID=A0A518HL96_9BACT|nr:hypothetical protein [Stieleria neptunia]QDV41631.1 hypothetical protein Enr13x_14740 [Stieleria neptunia]